MSLRNQALTWALRRWVKPRSLVNQDIDALRALLDRTPFGAKLPRDWRLRPERDAAIAGEWVEPMAPEHPARRRCILYLHGGGYVAMSPRTHRSVTSHLAAWSGSRLLALDYRLAPEHPFPAALDDALAAYRGLIARRVDPGSIAVAGDSAGGGLTLALLLALRDNGEPLPAAAALFSPWTDLAAGGASIAANDEADALMHGMLVGEAAKHYLGGTAATDPLASPVYGDLTGLPPLFIQVGRGEILLDDSRRIFAHAREAGGDPANLAGCRA